MGRVRAKGNAVGHAVRTVVVGAHVRVAHYRRLFGSEIDGFLCKGHASRMGIADGDFRCESTIKEVERTFGRGARGDRAMFDELLHRVTSLT